MARPTRKIERIPITKEQERRESLQQVQDALADNNEAVLGAIQLLKSLHESGTLQFLNGMFAEGDKILDVIVTEAAKDENTNAIKNLLLMGGTLGKLNIQDVEPLLLKLNHGVQRVAEDPEPRESTSYLALLKKLKDPDVNRSLTLMIRFLEGLGSETESEERN
ncbi:DUF1641 domain-containing protein [Alkalicoccus saliphilus]|jgi:uncharacterized protein YjgD (DUF1641 family)|uniref:DUF1641 domain-containing protein n=1 Tax=Alkalicoccus saliphilus TaxID=200989 RepID=A0A2T4U7Q9_9BACI|nr:DUF1641 domain-containing protein [Alkalicoccus saliphilus]PTL39437.1 hypothetical protein C6Y45_06300 [Alkalicoccus saliphilus]